MAKGDKMTPKKELFCKEYVIDLNGTQAAIRAGYSENSASEQAARLLGSVIIQKRIEELNKSRAERLEITSDMVLSELAKIGFIDIRKFYNEDGSLKQPHELDDNCAASLSAIDIDEIWEPNEEGVKQQIGLTKKIRLQDKIKCLELIGKHIGFFKKDNEQKPPIAQSLIQLNIDGKDVKLT